MAGPRLPPRPRPLPLREPGPRGTPRVGANHRRPEPPTGARGVRQRQATSKGAPPPPPPALPEELVQEILARLPPDDPACLLRAFLVCKAWALAVSHPGFRRRLHELHQAPPLLGFLPSRARHSTPTFIPTTASSFSLAAPDCHSWRAVDCRHGRALFHSVNQDPEALLVWEPITGAQNRLPVPAAYDNAKPYPKALMYSNAAVFCAADRCDHRGCFGGPFRVVFIFEDDTEEEERCFTWACEYSSETGAWGELTSLQTKFFMEVTENSSLLLGRSLYFVATKSILEYDLDWHAMTVVSPPDNCDCQRLNLMLTEDGGLGAIVQDFGTRLRLWTREASGGTDARWVLSRLMDLRYLLPTSARLNQGFTVRVMGFAEGANIIFVNSEAAGIFTIELQSEKVRKACDDSGFGRLVPLVTFYTPMSRDNLQNLLVSKPSEEAGGEEGRDGEKPMDHAQQLFDKGSSAINEGDFVNTFESISLDHDIRVPCCGEVAPGCASTLDKFGCAYEAQEVNYSLNDVPKSGPNEELVKGTTSEDDVGDSKTSGSNVEDAASSFGEK